MMRASPISSETQPRESLYTAYKTFFVSSTYLQKCPTQRRANAQPRGPVVGAERCSVARELLVGREGGQRRVHLPRQRRAEARRAAVVHLDLARSAGLGPSLGSHSTAISQSMRFADGASFNRMVRQPAALPAERAPQRHRRRRRRRRVGGRWGT